MKLEDELLQMENREYHANFIINKGTIPILLSAPHTMLQEHKDGTYKLSEPFTKSIALYLNKYFNVYSIVKIKDTGLDSNRDNHDDYKKELINIVKENDIKLVIDLHGASLNQDFDVELGTLNNLSADYSTINELKEAFIENGIKNISINDPFKGGAITQYLYNLKDVDVIQLEINRRYRDINNPKLLNQLIDSLKKFINQYDEYINR